MTAESTIGFPSVPQISRPLLDKDNLFAQHLRNMFSANQNPPNKRVPYGMRTTEMISFLLAAAQQHRQIANGRYIQMLQVLCGTVVRQLTAQSCPPKATRAI